jgi:glycosyltransferase involved in cell wall biosynthesis
MGINLVFIPFHDWKKCEREGFRTRDAHFMQEFEKHPDVDKMLVIDRPISISEMVVYRRNLRVKNGELLYKKDQSYLTKISDKVYVLDIFIAEVLKPLTMKRDWTTYIFGQKKVYKSFSTALEYLGIENDYSLFISQPLFVPLVKKIIPNVFVLDALDNLLKHPMYKSVKELQENYRYCLERADLVYTNSKDTADWFLKTRPDATHIPNGVDNSVFNPQKTYPIPKDVTNLSKPVIGYAGKMQELIDVDLIEDVLYAIPDVNFVFIGQKLNPKWTERLWKHSNAHYLGDKHYRLLPQYLNSFDICIIPIKVSRQHGGEPIKLYEYLAMGKPVVTTKTAGSDIFLDFPQVKVADSPEKFVEGLNHFLNMIKSEQKIELEPIPDFCLWKNKANRIVQDINSKIVAKKNTQSL